MNPHKSTMTRTLSPLVKGAHVKTSSEKGEQKKIIISKALDKREA